MKGGSRRGPARTDRGGADKAPSSRRSGKGNRHDLGWATARIQRKCAACAEGATSCPACEEESASVQRQAADYQPRATPDRVPLIQTRLTVNEPGDRWEREADAAAERVVRGPAPKVGEVATAGPSSATAPAESMTPVQRAPRAGRSSSMPSPPGVSGAGSRLDPTTRGFMESGFGAGFGDVRIHTGPQASQSAKALNARAYTSGSHVVFGAGEYQPESQGGRLLLAHELAHVVQQTGASAPTIQRAAMDDAGAHYDIDDTIRTLEAALRVALMVQKDTGLSQKRKAKIRTQFNRLLPVLGRLTKARDKDGKGVAFGFDPDPKKNEINAGDADRSLADLSRGWMDPPTPTNKAASEPALQAWALPGGLHLTPYAGAGAQRCELVCIGVVVLAGLLFAGCSSSTRSTPCHKNERETIKRFHDQGHEWVNHAVGKLAAYRKGSVPKADQVVMDVALTQNIHSTAASDVKKLEKNLLAIQTYFAKGASGINYTCICSTGGDAYTVGDGDKARIALCPKWFKSSDKIRMVTTVIHEVGHAIGLDGSIPISTGRLEDVYEFHKGYKTLETSKALMNPDPHAVFVRQVFHGGEHGPGTHR